MPTRPAAAHHLLAYLGLLLLASLSILMAKTVHWPYWDVAISLGIACAKAVLVLFVFMHLVEQPFRTRLALGLTVLLVLILIALSAADVATRETSARGPQPQVGQTFYRR
jgi:caa(3)-type oxidase subunit IV